MGTRTDIRFASYLKEVNGASALGLNPYLRAIWHPAHGEFVLGSGNGIIYTLDGISNKVQEKADIVAPANVDQIMVDQRNQTQTLITDNNTVAIDDGSLTNWTTGGASTQNTNCMFTLRGDPLLYKISQRVSFSNDNYVANETLGVTVFDFGGIRVCAQTPSGRLVVAQGDQTGFLDAGDDPNVVADWHVEDFVNPFGAQLDQMAVNDAGTLAILSDDFGDIGFWNVGAGDPTIYDESVNPFAMVFGSPSNSRITGIVYSAFWNGFIIIGANGRQGGFIDAANHTAGIDSILHTATNVDTGFNAREKYPTGAASPTGEIIVPGAEVHSLFMISPP